MDRYEITSMAREAGVNVGAKTIESLESFARLVAAKEREECAAVCEEVHIRPIQGAHEDYMTGKEMAVLQCARAIRMRSNVELSARSAAGAESARMQG